MSILSTNQKIINIGKEYSAGSGIDITNEVISVIGNTVPYSAGENIDIQDFVISGKDWSNDITDASANAYNETTAWVHDHYTNSADVSFLSGEIDKKLDSSAWEAVSASLATEDYVILSDNLTYARATAFTTAQEYAKESACNSAFDYLNQNKLDSSSFVPSAYYPSNNPSGFITGVDLTNYYQKNETSSKEEISAAIASIPVGDPEVNSFVESNSASLTEASNCVESNSGAWFDNVGDAEVNSFVYNNSASINDVNNVCQENSGSWNQVSSKLDESVFQETSGLFLTAIPQEYITESDIPNFISAKLDTTAFSTVSGDFLVASSLNGYATESFVENVSGEITALIPDTSNFITNSSAEATYQTIEGMTAYQPVGDYYSASNPSGFITGVDLTPYATTAEVDTLSSILSGAIDYVSANAGGGGSGVISSYTTTWSHDVPPYGSQVINSLNGLYISSFLSRNAVNAAYASNANSALSAGYAQTVNLTYVENEGFVRNLSSEYGTIYVTHNKLIDSTNSAISRTGYEGFVSSYGQKGIGPQGTAHYSWDESLPNNMFAIGLGWVEDCTLFYSADTNLTGSIQLPRGGGQTYSFDIPNATALDMWCNNWISVDNAVASAADTFETVVGELAWASALPSYEYNSTNKISAINGSAIAAGDEFPASANEAITAYQTNSGTYLTAISIPESSTWNEVSSKLDTTAFSNVSGTFLTAVDLTPYQTTAGMTAYQEALTFSYNDSDEISAINSSAIAGVTLPISGTNGYFSANLDTTGLGVGTEDGYEASYGWRISISGPAHKSTVVDPGYIDINDGSTETIEAQTIRDWNSVSSTVNSNSATWNSVSSKQDTLTFDYDGQNKISAINNSAIAGGSFDVVPISGTGSVNVYEQSNVLWVSGKDFTSDINYISGTIGDVETLLASL